MADPLFLPTRAAAAYLGVSKDELLAWVQPDRLPGDRGPPSGIHSGARLWSRHTLDAARPHVEAWRERDRAVSAAHAAKAEAERKAAKARRKGMRKGGALLAGKVCEQLGCSRTELDRWAADGRLPPDGEIVLAGLPKTVSARAWLPGTVDAAKAALPGWRAQDEAKKAFKRRGLRPIA